MDGGNSGEQRGGQGQRAGMGVGGGAGGGQGAGALDPLTRKSFIHFVAKAGDGFAPPPVGEAAAAVAATLATTDPSARVGASLEEQEGNMTIFLSCFFHPPPFYIRTCCVAKLSRPVPVPVPPSRRAPSPSDVEPKREDLSP